MYLIISVYIFKTLDILIKSLAEEKNQGRVPEIINKNNNFYLHKSQLTLTLFQLQIFLISIKIIQTTCNLYIEMK